MKKLAYVILIAQLLLGNAAWAQQAFVVKSIQFQGLNRISPSAVESYLPVKRGQVLRTDKTSAILRSLYQTGFFEQVSLSRSGDALIIHVIERPTIAQLKISGNSVIPTDKLTSVMKSVNISEGRVYDAAVVEKIRQSLLSQYYQLGRYNARVDVSATRMSRNRVALKIDISEGLVAKVRRISIIGNQVFSEDTLVKQMDLTTTGLITFVTQTDRYSEEKLEASVEKIRSYYMDRGYLKMEVKSAQAQVTPDRKSIYITIVVVEGQPYTVKDVNITGDMIIPREEIMKYVSVKSNTVFSRQQVMDTQKAIAKAYGDKGYMFASVSVRPQINDAAHTVSLTFDVKAGKRVYVRQVTFSDNTRTNDVVLRREVQQLEAAPASNSRMDESKQRLLLLPYIKEAEYTVKPVPGTSDQVDINYKVKEESSSQVSVKLGYSQLYHLTLGAGFNIKNFLGTGNTVGLNATRSKYEQFYGVDYSNPYYTEDGISRSISFAVSRIDPGGAGGPTGYTTNSYNLGVLYGIPIGQERWAYTRVLAGLSYQNLLVNLQSNPSLQVLSYINDHSRHSQLADFKLGISRDSRNRAIFPTSGSSQSLFMDVFAPLDKGSVGFYTINYSARAYQPIWQDQFILTGKANLGYGNAFSGYQNFPFFKNYLTGGIETVRGYLGNSLGPLDSNGNPLGGNLLVDGSIGLIFPNYISDNVRTSVFVDAGNVYATGANRYFGGQSSDAGPLRYSAGIDAVWLTPFGAPIEVSVAKPFNARHGEVQIVQLSFGANF
jgi:outer membrane protein insertion porin family